MGLGTKATISTLVKNLINKKAETKYVSHTVEYQTAHNSAITAGDIIPIMPQVVQGDGDYERLGDSVKPLSLRLRGLLSMNRNAVDSNQVLLVRVLVLSAKAYKSTAGVSANTGTIFNNLLKPNDDTATSVGPWTGDQRQLSWPVNADAYKVHYDKVFRIAPSTPEGIEENPASYARWSCKIKTPANLDFDNASSANYPTNFAPFLAIGYCYADGTGPDLVATKIVSYANSYLKYKDF